MKLDRGTRLTRQEIGEQVNAAPSRRVPQQVKDVTPPDGVGNARRGRKGLRRAGALTLLTPIAGLAFANPAYAMVDGQQPSVASGDKATTLTLPAVPSSPRGIDFGKGNWGEIVVTPKLVSDGTHLPQVQEGFSDPTPQIDHHPVVSGDTSSQVAVTAIEGVGVSNPNEHQIDMIIAEIDALTPGIKSADHIVAAIAHKPGDVLNIPGPATIQRTIQADKGEDTDPAVNAATFKDTLIKKGYDGARTEAAAGLKLMGVAIPSASDGATNDNPYGIEPRTPTIPDDKLSDAVGEAKHNGWLAESDGTKRDIWDDVQTQNHLSNGGTNITTRLAVGATAHDPDEAISKGGHFSPNEMNERDVFDFPSQASLFAGIDALRVDQMRTLQATLTPEEFQALYTIKRLNDGGEPQTIPARDRAAEDTFLVIGENVNLNAHPEIRTFLEQLGNKTDEEKAALLTGSPNILKQIFTTEAPKEGAGQGQGDNGTPQEKEEEGKTQDWKLIFATLGTLFAAALGGTLLSVGSYRKSLREQWERVRRNPNIKARPEPLSDEELTRTRTRLESNPLTVEEEALPRNHMAGTSHPKNVFSTFFRKDLAIVPNDILRRLMPAAAARYNALHRDLGPDDLVAFQVRHKLAFREKNRWSIDPQIERVDVDHRIGAYNEIPEAEFDNVVYRLRDNALTHEQEHVALRENPTEIPVNTVRTEKPEDIADLYSAFNIDPQAIATILTEYHNARNTVQPDKELIFEFRSHVNFDADGVRLPDTYSSRMFSTPRIHPQASS